ncbi:MAG TPA: flagellar filament capping protein FliD, partial [Gemmatimonadales bacterium]
MASIASFSGLASGIQWQDLIDQIMAAETARRVTPLNSQITLQQKRADAWKSYQGVVTKLADAAKGLRDGTAFGSYKAAASAGAGGRALLSATASASAAPGSYKVEVVSLAKAEKLSGNVVSSATTALGMTGEFAINGRKIDVAATDTLSSLRDRINAANSGADPSRVSASILSTGSGEHRLVLSSDIAGAAGIDLVDGDSGVLRQLGVIDSATAANTTASGGMATRRLSSVTKTIALALGVTMPPPTTIKVGDQVIPVDLTVDSLSSIAAKIQAQGIPARTVAETVDGRTTHRLEVEGTVTSSGAVGSDRAIELLGFTQPGRGAVSQVVAGEQPWITDTGAATGATTLTSLKLGGDPLAAGDVITIRGTRGDGGAVSATPLAIGTDVSTVGELLTKIEETYGTTRPVSASIGADGTISITDSQGGESKLSLSLGVSRGGTEPEAALLGRTVVETAGRLREVAKGADAVIRVDGSTITRGGNSITDVISGVTLSLQNAEPGTEIDVTVTRDDDAAVKAVKDFAAAYNEVSSFVKAQTAQGAPLAFNGTLRSTMSQLTNVLLTDLAGLPNGGTLNRATLVGVSLSKTGTLEVDESRLKEMLKGSFADVKALFGSGGRTSDASLEYVVSGTKTQPGSYEVTIDSLATRPTIAGTGFLGAYTATGAEDRLTITDSVSGKTVDVPLTDGMTSGELVIAMNAKLASEGLRVGAEVDAAGKITLTGTEYGSAARITVAYAPSVGPGSDPFGLVGDATGTDVAGTIDGKVATGSGRTLTVPAGADGATNAAEGLVVSYTGTTTGAVGSVSFSRGLGGMMTQVTDILTRGGDGTIAMQQDSITTSLTSLERRVADAESRIELKRESMLRQFAAMEAALARMQSQGNWLTQQVGM